MMTVRKIERNMKCTHMGKQQRFLKKLTAIGLAAIMTVALCIPALAASYKFTCGGYSRTAGESIGSIKSEWKLKELSRTSSCLTEHGEDVVYYRKGLTVKATSGSKGGTEYITQIRITKKKFKTPEGVKVGSTYQTLKSKYSGLAEQGYSGKVYYAKKDGVKVTFKLNKKGKVKSIYYTKSA